MVGIVGSRQTGKTTLARLIQKQYPDAVYLDLELPSDQNKLHEPELYLGRHRDALVIIDEIQKMPSLFPLIRALVDQNRVPGRFLILGSASPDMIRKSSESLAGRVVYHELPPFRLDEVGNREDREKRGGRFLYSSCILDISRPTEETSSAPGGIGIPCYSTQDLQKDPASQFPGKSFPRVP